MTSDFSHKDMTSQKERKAILVVEDEEEIRHILQLVLSQEISYPVLVVKNCSEALKTIQEIKPLLFLFNYQLPEMTGIELYDQLHKKAEFMHVPTILMSANLPKQEMQKRGIVGIEKPFDLDTIIDAIEHALL
jgi:CheY-like chemotaxis protein